MKFSSILIPHTIDNEINVKWFVEEIRDVMEH
jgi:hypothetical protein